MISRRNFARGSALGVGALLAGRTPLLRAAAETNDAGRPRFGVNYVPRKRWWYCWLDWDRQAVREDLSGVAGLGMDHIRIQCLWPLFQPGISNVSERALGNLASLMDAADEAGLDVQVTVLNGWMSGLQFMPAWVAPLAGFGKGGNLFTDRKVVEAEKLLLRRMAETVGGHRRFMGFDIANEVDVLMNPKSNPATMSEGDAWAREMLAYCDEIAPGKFHVNGIDHVPWFNDFGFSREQAATTGHASVIHSYTLFDGLLQHYKYSDAAAVHLAEYEVELAYAYHTDLTRRVWVEETGALAMPVSSMPEFMERSVRNIVGTGKVWGVTWWCSHDIDPAVQGFDEGEYHMGLLDLANRPKPLGKKFAELAAEVRRQGAEVVPRTKAMVIPDRGLSTNPWPPDWRYAKPFMELTAKGVRPAIVVESRAGDAEYLKARGITEVALRVG